MSWRSLWQGRERKAALWRPGVKVRVRKAAAGWFDAWRACAMTRSSPGRRNRWNSTSYGSD